MIKNLQLLMFVICSPVFLFAQESTLTIPKVPLIKVSDVYADAGSYRSNFGLTDKSSYLKLAPGSKLLAGDFNGYKKFVSSENNGMIQSMLIGIKLRDKQKTGYRKNKLIRVGFSYYTSLDTYLNYINKETIRYDTLTSNLTGQQFFIDSISEDGVNLMHSSEQLRLQASIIYSTESSARWCFYGGIGFSAGSTMNNRTVIYSYNNSYINFDYQNQDERPLYKLDEQEDYTTSNNFVWSVFTTAGLDFRIGKKRKFWQPIHLYLELHPTVEVVYNSYGKNPANTQITSCFGVRYQIQK
jgi:hypothetical protein